MVCVLSETADFQYKCTDYYYPNDQGGVIWNDPTVSIDWPINNLFYQSKTKIYLNFLNSRELKYE